MKHKVSELEGATLDAAVSLAAGFRTFKEQRGDYTLCVIVSPNEREPWKQRRTPDPQRYTECSPFEAAGIGFFGTGIPRFSTSWADGGPIIERERTHLEPFPDDEWLAFERYDGYGEPADDSTLRQYGSTPLIAAMRAYVASKLGDEVELP